MFIVGQRVWMRVWADGEPEGMATYKDGVVTAVSKTGAKIVVTYPDGERCYSRALQTHLLTESDMERHQHMTRARAEREVLHEAINNARDTYDESVRRLWGFVRGNGQMDTAYLARLRVTTELIEVMISSLSTTNQEDSDK